MDEHANQQSINDDQELAKVLAGVSQDADATPSPEVMSQVTPPVVPPTIDDTATQPPEETVATTDTPVAIAPPTEPVQTPMTTTASGELDTIKLDALNELRPLVDKLNVSPEEKFDTYLLLLRSTDDKALIAPAHDAAKNITDETRRAQALLDIIKEIDFLSNPQQP